MRTKLGVVLAIPTLALLIVSGLQIRTLVSDAITLRDFSAQVRLGQQAAELVHELQGERDLTVSELAAGEGARPPATGPLQIPSRLANQRKAVDDAARALRAAGVEVDGGQDWRKAYGRVSRQLEELATVRGSVQARTLNPRAAYDMYGRAVDSLLKLLVVPTPGGDNTALDQARNGYVELSRIIELGSQLRARVTAVGEAGFTPIDHRELVELRAERSAAIIRFRGAAPTAQVDRYDGAVTDQAEARSTQLEQQVVDGGGRAAFRMDTGGWWAASTERQDLLRRVEKTILAEAVAQATERSDRQLRRTLLIAGAIGATVLIGVVVSLLVGRSMALSLRALRRYALRVAHSELPEVLRRLNDPRSRAPDIEIRRMEMPRPGVSSTDEIGEMADAFAAVQDSAVSLAVEQAAMRRNVNTMFTNLARRSQVLVERQIELLDELEREERDPDLLGNLFKLDHLAARMRRNDDSLLVLAGHDGARRRSAPTPVSSVMLVAIAEIEHYPRVRHHADDSWHIAGHLVADVVHLLAELLENATVFSPPDTPVHIVGGVVGGQVHIQITDSGLGMSQAALDEANALLASPQAADVAASERMGLFVVSHLAARHGVRVRLSSPGRGVVADVWLPPEVLAPAALPDPLEMTRPALTTGTESTRTGAGAGAVASGATVTARARVPYDAIAEPAAASGIAAQAGSAGFAGPGHAAHPAGPAGSGGSPDGHPADPARALPPDVRAAMATMPQVDLVFSYRAPRAALPAGPSAASGTGPPADRDRGTDPTASGVQGLSPAASGARGTDPAASGPPGAPPIAAFLRPRRPSEGRSAWWSRAGTAAPLTAGAAAPAPPEVPITGGINERGLPVRVPMAQLPTGGAGPAVAATVPADEPDPDTVGSTLSRFYSGVRRAEVEDSTEQPAAPTGPRWEERQ